ncbi:MULTISPECIES: hypothetical protein [Pseudomonas]|uniref:Uncharacterized protein n=1 Tax=Pseudomonas fluorescens TaxID=294 RepID=A0A5E6WX38_PSEFL|nr:MULTISPECIES: hypothetical protein [Pseudomonas]VVN33155.1 hypothetical protein PS652_04956 [Pseudomonas fluorescens]
MPANQSNTITMNTGSAIDKDMYYMSCSFTNSSFDLPYSRMFFYQHKNSDKWFYHDLPNWHVVSTCFPPPVPGEVRKVYALSEEGDIECFSRQETTLEKIEDAGLLPTSKLYGYVNKLSYINGMLYACGRRGQIYRRNHSNWEQFDDGILQTASTHLDPEDPRYRETIDTIIKQTVDLFDIAGLKNNIYTVGSRGFIAHHDGTHWNTLKQLTAADLHALLLYPDLTTVLIVGAQGTILKGNAKSGFNVIARKNTTIDFYSATEYQGVTYIGGSDGIYSLQDGAIKKLRVTAHEVSSIESKDGVMWALASDKLMRFDGRQWEFFKHVDN